MDDEGVLVRTRSELDPTKENVLTIFEHPWVQGDVSVWDNLACTHGRTDVPSNSNRKLRRCKVAGEKLRE